MSRKLQGTESNLALRRKPIAVSASPSTLHAPSSFRALDSTARLHIHLTDSKLYTVTTLNAASILPLKSLRGRYLLQYRADSIIEYSATLNCADAPKRGTVAGA
jgi:hypothetical protein